MKIQLLALCDIAQSTQEGKLNIIGLWSHLMASSLPAIINRSFFVVCMNGEINSEHKIKITIEKDGKNTLTPLNFDVKIGPDGSHNLTIQLTNIALPEAGEYDVNVWDGDKKFGTLSFAVTLISPPKQKFPRVVN